VIACRLLSHRPASPGGCVKSEMKFRNRVGSFANRHGDRLERSRTCSGAVARVGMGSRVTPRMARPRPPNAARVPRHAAITVRGRMLHEGLKPLASTSLADCTRRRGESVPAQRRRARGGAAQLGRPIADRAVASHLSVRRVVPPRSARCRTLDLGVCAHGQNTRPTAGGNVPPPDWTRMHLALALWFSDPPPRTASTPSLRNQLWTMSAVPEAVPAYSRRLRAGHPTDVRRSDVSGIRRPASGTSAREK
jgi:hypothetical protein